MIEDRMHRKFSLANEFIPKQHSFETIPNIKMSNREDLSLRQSINIQTEED
jgi:hypothetical protein